MSKSNKRYSNRLFLFKKSNYLFLGCVILCSFALLMKDNINQSKAAPSSQLVTMENGHLKYTPYANQNESEKNNLIPDFSYCGYHNAGIPLPQSPIVKTLSPRNGDCSKMIQDAINEISQKPLQNSVRGTILLKSGKYELSTPLEINADGIILLGEGQNTAQNGGTELYDTNKTQHSTIMLKGSLKRATGTKISIIKNIPSGTRQITVSSSSGLNIGDTIMVGFTPNDTWIKALDMAQFGWTKESYEMQYERKITGISGNVLTIDIPTVQAITQKYGLGYVAKYTESQRLMECGVKNMMLTSYYKNDKDENHGWDAISLENTNNCFVQGVTARYYGYSCVNLKNANRTTVEDCAMLDPKSITTGGRKYSFNISKGAFNLFQRNYTRGGRHDYVTGARVTGPNAFVDCVAQNSTADVGPHHRYATGLLFDNIECGQIRVQNRGSSGTGHGWSGAQTMFWNVNAVNNEIKTDSPTGALNWCIGSKSAKKTGAGYYESYNTFVTPRSLYLQQLKDRLGQKAVSSVATNSQINGTILTQIKNWKGMGTLTTISTTPSMKPSTPPDQVSTIKPSNTPISTSNEVTLYRDVNYKDTTIKLKSGSYRASDLKALGFRDNILSSFRISGNGSIILYDGDNFTGKSLTFTQNDTSLINNNFNDKMTSIIIR